jgi:peptidoglycan/LPS O-acetylase OafA/YrhL
VRYVALDSWRGVCALAVAMFHFPIAGSLRDFPLFSHGYLFVDFFFVLSGFVIATAWERRLAKRSEVLSFLIRRFGRLWPLHAFVLGLYVAVSLIQGDLGQDERHSVAAIFTNVALIHGLGIHQDLTWNGPSWSISVEALLYVLFAFLVRLPKKEWIYVLLIVGSLSIIRWQAPNGMASTFDYGVFRGVAGFLAGVLVTRAAVRRFGLAAELAAVAAVAAFVSLGVATVLAPLVFALAVYVFANSQGPIGKAMCWAPITRLGEWSYSIYMNHSLFVAVIWAAASPLGLVQGGGRLLSPSVGVTTGVAAVYLVSVVGFSALTYGVIEKPAREAFNRLAARLPRPPT